MLTENTNYKESYTCNQRAMKYLGNIMGKGGVDNLTHTGNAEIKRSGGNSE